MAAEMGKDAKLVALLAPIEAQLKQMREVLLRTMQTDTPAVSDMIDHIGRFHGKQLRASLVLLAGSAAGNPDDELPAVAAVVELIHLATLVHDDVLDSAEKRRRVASVNRRWDNQVAVLLGDFLYSRAFHLSATLRSRLASQQLSLTTQEICAGEIQQAAGRWDFEMSLERSERIATAKTGALYGVACELGARYSSGDHAPGIDAGDALRMFGRELGLAFQLVDDVLDLVGDEEVVGKGVGTDVADGKVTWPVLHVYGGADEATRAAIRDAYTLPDLEQEAGGRLARLHEVCDLGPGISAARARAQSLVTSARSRIANLREGPARSALDAMGDFVLQRSW